MQFHLRDDQNNPLLQQDNNSESNYSDEDNDDRSSLNPQSQRRNQSRTIGKNYQSTNLIKCGYVTLADIILQESTNEDIINQAELFLRSHIIDTFDTKIIDPQLQLKQLLKISNIETMVNYDDIKGLSQKVLELQMKYQVVKHQTQPQDQMNENIRFKELSVSILNNHNYSHYQFEEELKDSFYTSKVSKNQRQKLTTIKQLKKKTNSLQLLHSLYYDSRVPMNKISKRLHIPYSRLRRIIKEKQLDPIVAFQKYKPRKQFKKIYPRVHNHIIEVLQNSSSLITVPALNSELKKVFGINIKNKMLRLYLKNQIGAKYQRIKQITCNHNTQSSKLQRQYAAANYINLLYQGKTIINIDESSFALSDVRRKGWIIGSTKNKQTHSVKLNGINIIAAISSNGDAFFTINNGITNSYTILFFILKLIEYLDNKVNQWRSKVIFMLDNAQYHKKSKSSSHVSWSISFQNGSSRNILFIYKKQRPEYSQNQKYQGVTFEMNKFYYRYQQRLLKEITLQIAKIDTSWVSASFLYVLQAALESLSLTPL